MLEIDIFRKFTQKTLGVLRGDFWVFVCSNDANAGYVDRLSP